MFKFWMTDVKDRIKNYFLQIWYCHHNAKVIEEFEHRMSMIIYDATNGRMSKPYYTLEAMRSEINDTHMDIYNNGYEDAKEDYEIKD